MPCSTRQPAQAETPDRAARARAMIELLARRQEAAARAVVPWFFEQMPGYYFLTHGEEEQAAHLRALVSGQVLTQGQVVTLESPCGTRRTVLSPGGGMEPLAAAVAGVAPRGILGARLLQTRDGRLRLDSFVTMPARRVAPDAPALARAVAQARAEGGLPARQAGELREFLATGTDDCVEKFEPGRALRHFALWRRIRAREGVDVTLEPGVHPGQSRITVAMMEPPARGALLAIVRILCRAGAGVSRAYADVYDTPGRALCVVSLYLPEAEPALAPERWGALSAALRTVKWQAPDQPLDVLVAAHGFTLAEAALLQAGAAFAHQFLHGLDPYAYTTANVAAAVLGQPRAARALLDYFAARFDPAVRGRAGRQREALRALREVRAAIAPGASGVPGRVFQVLETFVTHTLRTNYYLADRFGLGFRLDPAVLAHLPGRPPQAGRTGSRAEADEPPYGIFFFYGAHHQAFHVRYREMARGGVRLVPTASPGQFELEAGRQFAEVTALAQSQQSKNKDIPEGGAKAVVLLGPLADRDLAVKSVVDALLDVTLADKGRHSLRGVVDHLGRDEVIYLGPDENISPAHIEWIVARARARGHRWPSAIMSSKPRTGISHKRYGVTSLGVVVFAQEMLKLLGIDPYTQPFSVKFTGGTRGDVASNAMRILIRDHGPRVRIVSASDGHGALYDPHGLDHGELLRLADAGLGVAEFDPGLLRGPGALCVRAADPDGARLRDTLHNTAEADLFIPAGGRPDTISEDNWRDFLLPDGRPSARAVVEGANLFLSPGARDRLQESGVLVVHGASANKCGVISSSYEVLAGLALSDEEFLEIKDIYVAQVLDILRRRAGDEARLLVREYRAAGGARPLTALTAELSREINALADALDAALKARLRDGAQLRADPALYGLLLDYCPPVLVERFEARLTQRVPLAHLTALVAAHAAARAVYAEGIGWMRALAGRCEPLEAMRAYLAQEQRLAGFLEGLAASAVPQAEAVARILRATGRKYLTEGELGVGGD